MRDDNLIYDLGCHIGEDTGYYLKRGFRVVAVDANPELCEHVRNRFPDAKLTVVNAAIAEQPGEITFYDNVHQGWGTIYPEWADRNRRLGADSVERTVRAVTMADLIAEYGRPHYVKIDIEGADMVALKGLFVAPPRYVSIESNKTSFAELRREFATLESLGYTGFKIIDQRKTDRQKAEGHTFAYGSSGAFGEEAPGQWLTADEAIEAYKPIFLRYMLTGDDPLIRSRLLRSILWRTGFRASWYDTHAKLAD